MNAVSPLEAARLLDADFLYFLASAGWGVNAALALLFLMPQQDSGRRAGDRAFWFTVATAFLTASGYGLVHLFAHFGVWIDSAAVLDRIAHAAAATVSLLGLALIFRVLNRPTGRRRLWIGIALVACATVTVVAAPALTSGWWLGAVAAGVAVGLAAACRRVCRRRSSEGISGYAACHATVWLLAGLAAVFASRHVAGAPWHGVEPSGTAHEALRAWHAAVLALAAIPAGAGLWREYLQTCTLPRIRTDQRIFGLPPVVALPALEAIVVCCGAAWFVAASRQAEAYASRRLQAEVGTVVDLVPLHATAVGEVRSPERGARAALEQIVRRSESFRGAVAWTRVDDAGPVVVAAVTRDASPAPFDAHQLLPTEEEFAAVRNGVGLRWAHERAPCDRAVVFAPLAGGPPGAYVSLAVETRDVAGLVAPHRLQALAIGGLAVLVAAFAVVYTIRTLNEAGLRLLKESAEAENHSRNAFLGMISHEIRTPLQSVLGYAELAESAGLPEATARHVRAIRAQGAILLRIVQDILDFSALRGHALTLNPEAVSLRELLDDVQRGMAARAQAKGIVFSTEIEGGVPAWVTVDRVRLTQVLLNLAVNAVKFTDRGGVRIAVGCAGVSEGRAIIEILISDTGPGISAAQMRRLFEPFRKMRDDDTPGGGGVGLGLAISRQIVELLGGSIGVESADGEGTAFRLALNLPVAAGPAVGVSDLARAPSVPQEISALTGLVVLLIDDNPYVRDLLRDFLCKLGARVTVRADGASALEAMGRDAFDVIVMDLRLPDIAGAELGARLRAQGRSATDPWIVGISAGVSDAEIQATLERGVNDFMLKPVSMAGLAETIRMSPAASRIAPGAAPVVASSGGLSADQRASFFAELEPMFDRLEQSCLEEQGARLGAEAHYLANGCLVSGFQEGLEVCREIEQLAEAGAFAAARQKIAALRQKFAGGVAARGA